MKPIKEDAVYFPLATLYSKHGALKIKSWEDLFTTCEVKRTKDTLVDIRFTNRDCLESIFGGDYHIYRQIIIGTSDKIFYFNEVQKDYKGVLHEGFDRYNYIEKKGIEFECYFQLSGNREVILNDKRPDGSIKNPFYVYHTYDVVVLK